MSVKDIFSYKSPGLTYETPIGDNPFYNATPQRQSNDRLTTRGKKGTCC